jgi:Rhodanese-related sulfurtransferase
MFGFNKNNVITIDINDAYKEYLKEENKIIILNVDELVDYDERHIEGAENLPVRLAKSIEDYFPEKDKKYYVYSLKKGAAYHVVKIILKKGYDAYLLSDYTFFKGDEEGLSVKKKRRKKRC